MKEETGQPANTGELTDTALYGYTVSVIISRGHYPLKLPEGQTVNKRYRFWNYAHSLFFLAIGVYLLSTMVDSHSQWLLPAAAMTGVCSFGVLFLLQGRSSISIPNTVSILRLVLVVLAVALLSFGDGPYVVFILFALAGLTDFFDGLVARRLGTTPFGAKLDMELDAVLIFMLAATARLFYGQERLVLVAGLLRYGYVVLLLPFLPDPGEMPFVIRLLSKGACALAEIALIAITVPILPDGVRSLSSSTAVGLLSASFLLDAVLRLVLQGE